MTTPHKWAAEIHAMADGRKVEGNFSDFGSDIWTPATNDYNPLTHPSRQWRIVPEKQVLKYRMAKMKGLVSLAKMRGCDMFWLECVYNEEVAGIIQNSAAFVEWLGDWQEVEI